MISWHIDTLPGGDVETTSTATGCHWANPKLGGLPGEARKMSLSWKQGMCVHQHGPTWTNRIACCLPNMAYDSACTRFFWPGWQIGEIRPPGSIPQFLKTSDRRRGSFAQFEGAHIKEGYILRLACDMMEMDTMDINGQVIGLQLLSAVSARFPLSLFQRGWQPGTSSQCEQRQHLCECGNSGGLMMEIVRSCASLVIQMVWKMPGYSQVQTSNLQWKSHK